MASGYSRRRAWVHALGLSLIVAAASGRDGWPMGRVTPTVVDAPWCKCAVWIVATTDPDHLHLEAISRASPLTLAVVPIKGHGGTMFLQKVVSTLSFLKGHPEFPLAIITDGFDIAVRPTSGEELCTALSRAVVGQAVDVIVSAEYSCWTYKRCTPLEVQRWSSGGWANEGKPSFPNAGAMAGTRVGLIKLLHAMIRLAHHDNIDFGRFSDQTAIHYVYPQFAKLARLDVEEQFFATAFRHFSRSPINDTRMYNYTCAWGPCWYDSVAAINAPSLVSHDSSGHLRLRVREGKRMVDPFMWHYNGIHVQPLFQEALSALQAQPLRSACAELLNISTRRLCWDSCGEQCRTICRRLCRTV